MSAVPGAPLLRTEVAEGRARIVLDRPPVNVLTTSMMTDLAGALRTVSGDSRVRVVTLSAAGKTFSAGVDVADHVGDKLPPMMEALADLFRALEGVPQPLVAIVQGACLGGGLELVLGCDLVLASERASFGQPEIKLGVFAPPATVLLPRLIGERRAAGMLLLGESIDALQAERIGLVHQVFPADGFESASDAWVAKLLALSGAALARAKAALAASRALPLRAAHERVHDLYLNDLMRTEDATEGLSSFVAKRPPVWRHR